MGAILGWLLKFLGGGVIDRTLSYLEKRADSETERQRIASQREQALAGTAASVVVAGMSHRMFWVAWSIAAIPTAAWHGWGMLDSLCNGALPDVAELPPQLKEYADVVFANIFYSGAGMAAAQTLATAIVRRK